MMFEERKTAYTSPFMTRIQILHRAVLKNISHKEGVLSG